MMSLELGMPDLRENPRKNIVERTISAIYCRVGPSVQPRNLGGEGKLTPEPALDLADHASWFTQARARGALEVTAGLVIPCRCLKERAGLRRLVSRAWRG
jgi:hypothetical protein